jgi:hypothetical protein
MPVDKETVMKPLNRALVAPLAVALAAGVGLIGGCDDRSGYDRALEPADQYRPPLHQPAEPPLHEHDPMTVPVEPEPEPLIEPQPMPQPEPEQWDVIEPLPETEQRELTEPQPMPQPETEQWLDEEQPEDQMQ